MQNNISQATPEIAKKMDKRLLEAVDFWSPPEVLRKTACEKPYIHHRLRSEVLIYRKYLQRKECKMERN